jgi:hypothetical protein
VLACAVGAADAVAPIMKTLRTTGALSLVAVALLLACEHTDQTGAPTASGPAQVDRGQPGAANAQAPSLDNATVEQLSGARCDREQSCNNVGAGQKYAAREVCMEQMRGSLANDLNSYNCPRGINRDNLDRCMAAIRGEECNHPLDTIVRMDKCRDDALCMK